MAKLNTAANLPDPDAVYARLIAWHDGCDAAESHKRNAKLVLILANHIGDPDVLAEAMALAEGRG